MKKYIFPLLLSIVFVSCQRGRKVKDLPAKPGYLVINSVINNREPMYVFVTTTASPGDTTYLFDTTVAVSVYENGAFKATLPFDKSNGGYFYNVIPTGGTHYKIGVRKPGSITDDSWTETTLPKPILFTNVSFLDSAIFQNGEWISEIKFRMTDGPDQDKYRLLFYGYQSGNYIPFVVAPIDHVLTNNNTERDLTAMVFSDNLFSGKSHEFVVRFPSGNIIKSGPPRFIIEMTNISKEYDEYVTSLGSYQRQARNPFSNPVSIYTNVYNGLGIFAGYTIKHDTIP